MTLLTPSPTKAKQINIRLTPAQETALKRFCVKNGVNTQTAIIDALAKHIEGF